MNTKLITNFLVFSSLFLIVWFVVLPVWSDISAVRSEIKSKQGTVDLERRVIEKLNSISQVLDEKKPSVERLEQAIPTSELRPELLSIMENLASQNGMSLKSISVDTAPEDTSSSKRSAKIENGVAESASLKNVKINVSSSGSYSAFKSWIGAIEKNLRITDISKISFSIPEKKDESGKLEFSVDPIIDYSVDMSAYVLKK